MKMEDFYCKTRLVAGEHNRVDASATVTYAGVESREIIHILLMITVLNVINVIAAYIINTYITTPGKDKAWRLLDPEFDKD